MTFTSKAAIAVPTMDPIPLPVKVEPEPKEFATLKGERIQLPEKPKAPDDCCMR